MVCQRLQALAGLRVVERVVNRIMADAYTKRGIEAEPAPGKAPPILRLHAPELAIIALLDLIAETMGMAPFIRTPQKFCCWKAAKKFLPASHLI